ncbi:MAG TPA: MATE family efflux transporter [Polyangiales bacterium]|nr:MATE family efflux transporter [Polyangiales bacterium]
MDASAKAAEPRMRVWPLAWPAVLTNLLQSSVGIIDIKVVGSLGASAVAAATAGHRLFFVLQATLMAVSVGTTALVARAIGAVQREEAARVVSNSLVIATGIAAVTGLLGLIAAEPFALLFGLGGDARELAIIYIRWISCFTPAFAVGFVISSGLRAAGDTRTPLLFGAVSNVANIGFLYVLVYGGFGFPKLGIAGASLAGGLAFSVSAVLTYALWRRRSLVLEPVAGTRLERTRVRKLVRIGYPAALEQLVVQGGFIAFTLIIARCYGTLALAAYGIGVQILSLSFVVGFGFSIAASTLVGQQLGAGSPQAAAASGWRALWLAVGSMSVLAVIIVTCARPIARAMIDDPAVVELTVSFIYWLGAAQPLMAAEYALGGALRGAGDTRFPLLTTFAGLILGRVVLAGVFTWLGLPVVWVYGALMADYLIKAFLLLGRFRSGRWQRVLRPSLPPAE